MTPPADPREYFKRQCLSAVLVGGTFVTGVTIWALFPLGAPVPLELALAPTPPLATAEPSPATAPAGQWDVVLWQPLVDLPPPPPPPPPLPPPVTLKLFSVIKRGGSYLAALDPGDGTPLQYAKAGDHLLGIEVVEVGPQGVTILNGTHRQRLELTR